MPTQNKAEQCPSCSAALSGPFCAVCGRPQELRRIDGRYILSELASVLNFQKGILFTIRELLIRPGLSVRKFIHEDRNRLVKPISFIILCSLIYIIAQQSLQFQDGYVNYSELDWKDSTIGIMLGWITKNYGFTNIIMAVFIALWVKILFRKYDYNLFEILILLYFIIGMQMFFLAVFGSVESITNLSILDKGSLFAVLYVSWAMGRFFDHKKRWYFLKGFFSYMLGIMTFLVVVMVFGGLIDMII